MIYFCIIVYNKKIEDSLTYNTLNILLSHKGNNVEYDIYIYDNTINSQLYEINRKYAIEKKLHYYGNKKNIGISKAYNQVLLSIFQTKDVKENDFWVSLDDDSKLDEKYLENMILAQKKCKADIYLPIVYANEILLSPCNVTLYGKTQTVKNIKKINKNKVTAINSGTWIRLKIFEKINYDERLFIDGVDHLFFEQVREKKYKIFIVENAKVFQTYSEFQTLTLNEKIERFKYTLKDNYTYYNENILKKIFFCAYIKKLCKRLDSQYKTHEFSKMMKEIKNDE